jgi:RsiW-degrading membrane proteinase PrsW (M82 family)
MLFLRGMLSGLFVWTCVSLSFYLLGNIPIIKDFFYVQAFIVMICISVYAFLGAQFYYKKGYKTNGVIVGIIISGTALLLDIFITVPLVEIPNGRSYESFFSSPVLWILVVITVFTVYFYWRKNIKIL